MTDSIATGFGLIAALGVLVLVCGLVASLPVVAYRALLVAWRREWIPVSYNLRSLSRRKVATSSTFAVLSLVIFVLTAVMMLAAGIGRTLSATGGPLNVKIIYNQALSEWLSRIPPETLQKFSALPGIARNPQGEPLVSGEMVVLIWAPYTSAADADDGANITVRGVQERAFEVHPLRVRGGRRFTIGTQEVLLGKALVGRFPGAEIGGQMVFADRSWTVVGVADHGGTAHDSEIWGDVDVMGPTFRRGFSTATVTLTDREALGSLRAALASDATHSDFVAKREADYWRAISENYVEFVTLLGAVVGFIFSFGAILGALNTMYAQVTARTREIGALRALGFKPRAILVSLVFESVLLSLAAGIAGIIAASLLQRVTFQLSTVQTLSEITYGFQLTPQLALASLVASALMGYAGGLLPALRAARMRIVDAVRAD